MTWDAAAYNDELTKGLRRQIAQLQKRLEVAQTDPLWMRAWEVSDDFVKRPPFPGSIYDICKEAAAMANEHGLLARVEFNGVRFEVKPGGDPQVALDAFLAVQSKGIGKVLDVRL